MPQDMPLQEQLADKITEEVKAKPEKKAVFITPRDRYVALLKNLKKGGNISEDDQEFMLVYEENMDEEELFYISSSLQ